MPPNTNVPTCLIHGRGVCPCLGPHYAACSHLPVANIRYKPADCFAEIADCCWSCRGWTQCHPGKHRDGIQSRSPDGVCIHGSSCSQAIRRGQSQHAANLDGPRAERQTHLSSLPHQEVPSWQQQTLDQSLRVEKEKETKKKRNKAPNYGGRPDNAA